MSAITLDGVQVAAVSYDAYAQLSGVAYGPAGSPVTSLGSLARKASGALVGQSWTVGARTIGESLTRSQGGADHSFDRDRQCRRREHGRLGLHV